MNIIIILTPLIGTVFGVMYYYNSREFTELLLAQPIKQSKIFMGQFLGISISLSLSLVLGIGIPFVFYGLFMSTSIFNFSLLLIVGTFLNFIFVALSYNIALSTENKIKGFGYAILMWLFFSSCLRWPFADILINFQRLSFGQILSFNNHPESNRLVSNINHLEIGHIGSFGLYGSRF